MDLQQALTTVHDLVNPVTTDWLLIGTTSLYLQGYTVEPHDIDILCALAVAEKIANALATYHLPFKEEVKRDKFRSAFSCYLVNGVTVEVMGDLEVNAGTEWIPLLDVISQTDEIIINQRSFRVPSKADQLRIYQLFGRAKDDQVIRMLSL